MHSHSHHQHHHHHQSCHNAPDTWHKKAKQKIRYRCLITPLTRVSVDCNRLLCCETSQELVDDARPKRHSRITLYCLEDRLLFERGFYTRRFHKKLLYKDIQFCSRPQNHDDYLTWYTECDKKCERHFEVYKCERPEDAVRICDLICENQEEFEYPQIFSSFSPLLNGNTPEDGVGSEPRLNSSVSHSDYGSAKDYSLPRFPSLIIDDENADDSSTECRYPAHGKTQANLAAACSDEASSSSTAKLTHAESEHDNWCRKDIRLNIYTGESKTFERDSLRNERRRMNRINLTEQEASTPSTHSDHPTAYKSLKLRGIHSARMENVVCVEYDPVSGTRVSARGPVYLFATRNKPKKA